MTSGDISRARLRELSETSAVDGRDFLCPVLCAFPFWWQPQVQGNSIWRCGLSRGATSGAGVVSGVPLRAPVPAPANDRIAVETGSWAGLVPEDRPSGVPGTRWEGTRRWRLALGLVPRSCVLRTIC